MPVHRAQIVTPDVSIRRVSFAAEVIVLGSQDNMALKPGQTTRKVTFTAGVEVAGDGTKMATKPKRKVSFAKDVEIIKAGAVKEGRSSGRHVSFADDVEVIGTHGGDEVCPTTPPTITTDFDADLLFAADDNGSQQPLHLTPPPRHSSLNWARSVGTQLAITPPPRVSSLRGMLLSSSIPLSPPPPYQEDVDSESDFDGAELDANLDPVPSYHDDRRPPRYTDAFFEGYSVTEEDIVLEDVLGRMGNRFMEAFGALRFGPGPSAAS